MENNMQRPFPQGNRRPTRKEAKDAAKHYVAKMKVRLSDGGRSAITSPKALKVIERGTVHLLMNEGRPFAMQISHGEAAAFFDAEADQGSRYAMAFAMDKNRNPYHTLPVGAFPLADRKGPAPTADELAEQAEMGAYSLLFNNEHDLQPYGPAHTVRGWS